MYMYKYINIYKYNTCPIYIYIYNNSFLTAAF